MTIFLERLAWFVPLLLGVSLISFALLYVIPGDPVLSFVGERASPETIAQLRAKWGLDQPLLFRYFNFIKSLFTGDFGTSYRTQRAVRTLLMERLKFTIILASLAFILAAFLGLGLGVAAVCLGKGIGRRIVLTVSTLSLAIPVYLWALFFLWLFGVHFRLLPAGGYDGWSYVLLPALSLATRQAAVISRWVFQNLMEELGADYMRTARAKGVHPARLILKHGLRNAILPVITVMGMDFASYLNGSVLTESVFGWPGLGRLTLEALIQRDFPVVQGAVFLAAVVFLSINLILDIFYVILDPRLRYH